MKLFNKFPDAEKLVSDPVVLFSDLQQRDLNSLPAAQKEILRDNAARSAELPTPPLTASLYAEFARDGNRSHYQKAYYARRNALYDLMLAEMVGDRRFHTRLCDLCWMICEETSWVIPAHNVAVDGSLLTKPLPDAWLGETVHVDLFSACTGALLAFCCRLLSGDDEDDVTKMVRQRMLLQLHERIIEPYLKYDMRWLTVFVNNWLPWITANVLNVAALVCDRADRVKVINRALPQLDCFVETYLPDGGCNEGPGYWDKSVGMLFDCLELLYDLTDGRIDIFDHPLLKRMGNYIRLTNISEGRYITIADSHPHNLPSYIQIERFGLRSGNPALAAFGAEGRRRGEIKANRHYECYRSLKDLLTPELPLTEQSTRESVSLDDTQVAVLWAGELCCAVKGGHNNESHNHNDVGSLQLYDAAKPVIMDPGVGEYTRDTFNENRYQIWTMRSPYHSLPIVNGCEQLAGREYRAGSWQAEISENRVTVEAAEAYDKKAGLQSFTRTAQLDEAGLIVTDELSLAAPGDIVFTLLLHDRPAPEKPGCYRLTPTLCLHFPAELKPAIEEISLAGSSQAKEWDADRIYNLRLTAPTARDCRVQFTVTRE